MPASCRAGGLGAEERLPRNFCRPAPGASLALQVGARVCTPCVCVHVLCVHASVCVCVHSHASDEPGLRVRVKWERGVTCQRRVWE